MYSSQPSNQLRGTLPATQQVQPDNVAAAPQHLPGVLGGVAPGVTGVLPQTQQNQQDMLGGLPRLILNGLNDIRAKQQRVLALRRQAAQLEAEVQQDSEKLLLQYHAVQQQEAGLQQQDLNRLQTRCAGLEQDHGQLQREHGQLQYDLGQLEEAQGVLVQEKASLQLQLGQMQQQQGQQRRLQYSQTQQMPQGLQQSQPQQPIQQQPHQVQQPLQAKQTLQTQQPFQAQQPVHAQQLLQTRQPPQVQQPIQQQFFHPPQYAPPQQLAPQYAQQPQLPQQFTHPHALQTYQVPRYPAQQHSQRQHTSPLGDWDTNTPDAYGQEVYEVSDDESYEQQRLSSQVVPSPLHWHFESGGGGAPKRARGDEGTDDDVSTTGSRKRQKTATSDVRPDWLQEALSGGPASAADAISDLDSFSSGGVNRSLKRGLSEQDLLDHIRRLEAWVDLVASRGGDAMPIMMFGFDQLARKWSYACSPAAIETAACTIPHNMLRLDTPESFRALWQTSRESFDSSAGGKRREETWNGFRNAVMDACALKRSALNSARLPIRAQRNIDARETDESTASPWETRLRLLPFKWGESLGRLGERLSSAAATAGATTTTTNNANI